MLVYEKDILIVCQYVSQSIEVDLLKIKARFLVFDSMCSMVSINWAVNLG